MKTQSFPLVIVVLLSELVLAQGETWAQEADLAILEKRLQAAHDAVRPAVVRVSHAHRDDTIGSGVVVSAEGHVVTTCNAKEGLEKDDEAAVYFADGRRAKAVVLGVSYEWSIRLVKITDPGPWPHVEIGAADNLHAGQPCIAMDYPMISGIGFESRPAVYVGHVTESAPNGWFSCSCPVSWHGAGVFDLEGRLLGVTALMQLGEDVVNTNADRIRACWEDLVAGANLDRVRLTKQVASGLPPSDENDESRPDAAPSFAVDEATAATVRLRTKQAKRGWSGVVITPQGHIATCAHCRHLPGDEVTIEFPDGRNVSGVALGTNRVTDIALVKIVDPGAVASRKNGQLNRIGARCVMPRRRLPDGPSRPHAPGSRNSIH